MKKLNKYLIFSVFIFMFFININTTKAATTTIDSIQDLYNVRDDLSGNYELGVDLDFNDIDSYDETLIDGYDLVLDFKNAMTSGTGWNPIGTSTAPFIGNFDGNSYIISNLFINRPATSFIGLFGYTESNGILIDILLEDVDITGTMYVGGLVGLDTGATITNSYFTGSVSGSSQVGGLVGQNNGGTITNSYFTGSVSGTGDVVGGLVGFNAGTITNSYFTGSVSGTGDVVGGLVGQNVATITNSYSTGNVNGGSNVGGLVGDNYETITNSYFTGSVSGTGDVVGGLVGFNARTITNSYSTGSVDGGSNVGGLAGYNDSTITNSYSTGSVSGSSKVGGLIGYIAGGTILDSYSTGDVTGTGDYVGGLIGYVTGGTITNSYSTGSVDGGSNAGGLVGRNSGATITNSYSTGSVIGTGNHVGGLVGDNYTTISNSYSTGDVTGTGNHVGGLVGDNYTTISDSYSTGDVTGTGDYVGGLVGANYVTISNSYSTGSVTGTELTVGGLSGANYGTITNSYYNSQTSGQSDNDGRGTPRTTLEMTYPYDETSTTTYVGWNFDTIWYHDTTGIVNSSYPYNYYADIIQPTSTILIDSGDISTNSTTVTLTFTASDNYSAITSMQMMISNYESFTTSTGWIDYANSTSTWEILGTSGVNTVYFKIKDEAGNISATSTDTIIFDNTSPVITILGSNPLSIYKGDSYYDEGATATDAVDGDITNDIVTTSN
ncbi:MAG: GLUG motif-containing protein, partial [Patescibacteria group bacterium]|nr:GLUG motif-containing protein [Patescibacteria group bacterium]MDD4694821.1 GLUG motif-containing protein [Patescibacteria group bacterium]